MGNLLWLHAAMNCLNAAMGNLFTFKRTEAFQMLGGLFLIGP